MTPLRIIAPALAAIAFLAVTPARAQGPSSFHQAPGNAGRDAMDEATRRILGVAEKSADGWSVTFEPYLWALGVSGQIGVGGFGPSQVDVAPQDVLRHLDWGVMAKGEVRKGSWALLGDGIFAQLSASGSSPGPLYESANVKIQQGMASASLACRILEGRQGFLDAYAGARFNYLGINLGGSPDSEGIQEVSDAAVRRISQEVGERVDAYLSENAQAIKSALVEKASSALADKVASVNLRKTLFQSLRPSDVGRIVRQLRHNSGAYRALVATMVQSRMTDAKERASSAIQRRVQKAQKDFARALAKKIEEKLPTGFDGEQWWVDPIVGLRGQLNLTRWLFVAAQCDVGGFGASSLIAWDVKGSIGINWTRHLFTEAGWRYYYTDYEAGGFVYKVAESGILIGTGVRF